MCLRPSKAFKNHKLCNPLENPGDCDLTYDVDFAFLKDFVTKQGGS
jgi:SAM-dependent MidA family methyltransferase